MLTIVTTIAIVGAAWTTTGENRRGLQELVGRSAQHVPAICSQAHNYQGLGILRCIHSLASFLVAGLQPQTGEHHLDGVSMGIVYTANKDGIIFWEVTISLVLNSQLMNAHGARPQGRGRAGMGLAQHCFIDICVLDKFQQSLGSIIPCLRGPSS